MGGKMEYTAKLLFVAITLFPSLVLGMETIADEELSTVTAQSGITLTVDDFILYQSFGKVSFTDTDGGNTSTNPFPDNAVPRKKLLDLAGPASLNLEGLKMDVLRVNALGPKADKIGSNDTHYKFTSSNNFTTFTASPLTIDVVDEIPSLSPGLNYGLSAKNNLIPIPIPSGETYNCIGVWIGFPTIELYIDELSMKGLTVTTMNRQAVNSGSSIMGLQVNGVDIALLSGMIDIAPHHNCGLDAAPDDITLYIKINEIRFSDSDGLSTDDPANLVAKNVVVDKLMANCLTVTDFNALYLLGYLAGTTRLNALSLGLFNCHLYQMDNFVMLDITDVPKSFHGWPLSIDYTRSLPLTAQVLGMNQGKHYGDLLDKSVGGIDIAAGTIEFYADSLKIGAITIEDPSGRARNNGASFFPISMKNAQTDQLNGMLEVSTH
jgi:hypothetical protein